MSARNPEGRTALLVATYGNHPAVARLMIDAGADVNAQDAIRNSAFLLAGARRHLEILRMTLGADADLRSRNRFGGTAHIEIVRLLVAHGASLSLPDGQGVTPLEHARRRGYLDIQRALLAAGAS